MTAVAGATPAVGRVVAAGLVLAAILAIGRPAAAQDNTVDGTVPGLGNLEYQEAELWQPISTLQPYPGANVLGYGRAFVADGYLCLIRATDGNQYPTNRLLKNGIDVWDISNPRDPIRVQRWDDRRLREAHGLGLWNRDGQIILVAQTHEGIAFYDVSSIGTRFQRLAELDLRGVNRGDYRGAWWLSVQAPYVYVAALGRGLYVVEARDPGMPRQVKHLPTGQLGGISPASVSAVGNLLVLAKTDSGHGYATLDISDPVNPVLIETIDGAAGYSHLFTAGQLFASGSRLDSHKMYVYDVGHDGRMRYAGEAGEGLGAGGYGSYQDGHFIGGFSDQVAKFSLDPPTQVGTGSSGLNRRDEEFAQPLGNLLLASDDHGVGTALIPHQAAPDTSGPEVVWTHPADGATGLALTTRVGVSLSDEVAIESLTAARFRVTRPDGTAVAGQLSANQTNVNFTPDAPLATATTYTVEVCRLKDLTGNIGGCKEWTFSTRTRTAEAATPSCRLDRFEPVETDTARAYVPTATMHAPTTYTWNFGSGDPVGPQATATAAFTYTEPGRYPVVLTVANAHGMGQCTSVQIVHAPVTETAPVSSSSIITTVTAVEVLNNFFRDRLDIYVANPDNDTVTRIFWDNTKVWEVEVGTTPRTLAEAPDGTIWVANQGSGNISVLNREGELVRTIDLGYGAAPYGLVFAPDGNAAYVTLTGTGRLLKLDPTDGTTEASLTLGTQLRGIAVSGDSARIFVTRFVSAFAESGAVGQVYEVDAATLTLTRTLELAFDPGPDTESSGRGVPNYLSQVRIAPDGQSAWIPSKKDNIARGRHRDGLDLDFETQTRTIVSRIDLSTNTEVLDRRIDFNDRDLAQALVFTPMGDVFIVAFTGSNVVEVWDAAARTRLSAVQVGRAPIGLALRRDGRRLYVHNFLDRSVTVLNTEGLLDGTINQPPVVTTVSAVEEEELAPEVLRGKRIFYNAADNRMNRDGYVSCASCHLDGGADGMVWDRTQGGEGLRNTIDLRGRRGTNDGLIHWSGNFDEIQDFENDIRELFDGMGFMSDSDFSAGTRNQPLGEAKAGVSDELDDLAAYVESLDTYPRSPYRQAGGGLTAAGQAGRAVFAAKDCARCHVGQDFTDDQSHDVGTTTASSGKGGGAPLIGINTPTLKGLWLSAPYLHDGSARTMTAVLDNATHMGATLTTQEKTDLAAYLAQIDENDASDTTVPAVLSITSDATHPTKDSFTVTITFTKAVTGLTAGELSVTNGSGSNFAGAGTSYTLDIEPNANIEDDLTVRVPAGAAVDGVNSGNVEGIETFAVDTQVPALLSAVADGNTLTLSYGEALGSSRPEPDDFTVYVENAVRSVSGVAVKGRAVTLTLASAVAHGEAVTVSYTPGTNRIRDVPGNEARELSDQSVTNPTGAQNTAPSITSPSTFSAVEGNTAVTTLTATDADSDPLTWALADPPGADGARFSLSASGELAFVVAPDYEHPDDADADRGYEVSVAVSDAVLTTTQDLMVTVTDLAPGLTGPATASHAEGKRGLRIAAYTVNDDVAWSLTGADSALFTIAGGFLRFVDPPDFENPDDATTDNVYNVTVEGSDGTATETTPVAVTVTDVNEPGTVTLSSLKPKLDTALTATLADPDTVSGTPTWQWQRANGREGWEAIDGATAASYTPTAAEADRYLRATATYTDGHGAGKTAQAIAPHVVIAHRLSALTVSGLSGVPSDDRAFYPAFDPDTLHYAARCTESVTLTLTTEDDDTRLSVNGVQRPKGEAFTVDALGRESDIRITLTGSEGASTTYTVHCIDREEFPKLTTVKADGATEDLMMFRAKWHPSGGWRGSLIMMDNNGVPRLRKWIDDNVYEYFRVFPDETHPRARYAFTKYGTSYNPDGVELVVLDKYFNTVDDDVHVLSPFNNTDGHDQIILPNGDYVLMAYSNQRRNLRFLRAVFPELQDSGGGPLGNEAVMDSAIQVRTADGTVKLNWDSWDHMAIEDCVTGSTFRDEYGHINALGLVDGDIIAGFRHCSKILRIDVDTGDVVWRAGPSILSREQWEAGETLQPDRGPAPLEFVNDPRGGFSGQHGGHMTVDGNLLVYDNATHCGLPPGVPEDAKGLTQCEQRTRAVEYAIDLHNEELVFQREFRMPGDRQGGFAGHAEPLDNGDWVISWSNVRPSPATAVQVDAETDTQKLSMTLENIIGNRGVGEPHHTRVVMVSPVALAARVEPLTATIVSRAEFHNGTAARPTVVVAFNRPVVDFDDTTPSLNVAGATVSSVSPHVVAGEAANAYVVTLTPAGTDDITVGLAADQPCADGGICTVDGTVLSEVPALHVIRADTTPPAVSKIEITSNPGSDRVYIPGDEIQATVTFSETVAVTGMPQLTLELGGSLRTATYQGRTGTDALVFAYEVVEGESDDDGVGVEADSLSTGGGTIRDGARNDAVLDHEGLAANSGHKVDAVKPELAATGGAVVNGTTLRLTYNEPLGGSSTPEPGDFTVDGGDHARMVTRVLVSGTAVELTLDPGAEHEEAGIRVSYTPGANPIRDVPGNAAEALSHVPVRNETPDTTPPEVESLGITSNPGSDQTYAAEDEIEVTVRFSETVEVEGTPRLTLRVGSRNRPAGYLRGSGAAALVFAYPVADSDLDTGGVSIAAGRIDRNGGTIKDEADNDAVLDHEAVAPPAGHKVDGVRPAFLSAAVDGSSLTLTYGEALDEGSRPAPGDFTVEVGGTGRSVSAVSVSGSVVTLTLDPAVEHGDTGIRVNYSPGTRPIRDAVGNDALALSNRSVTNTTGTPNTAPEITSPGSFDVPENQALVRRLAARDDDPGDEVTGWEIVGGADRFQFSVARDTGELSFQTAPDFEAPGDNEYEVTVEVRSGTGARELEAEQMFTVRVTDEREPPSVPEAPTFSGETPDSLTVNWREPDNSGPAITDYNVQYREEGTGRFQDGQHEGPRLALTLSDLKAGTVYEVQVRARNDEGTGDWSESGEGMTIAPLTVGVTADPEPPVEAPFTVRFSFPEPVTGFSGSDIETDQEPACMDDQNSPVFCDPGIGSLQTADDRIYSATVTPVTDGVANNYTLTLTVPAGRVIASVGNKPNEEATLEVRVAPPGVTVPISSTGLRASSGNGRVTMRWNAPGNTGGAAMVRYEYRVAESGGGEFSAWRRVAAAARSATVSDLTNGQEYVSELRAVNALGYGGVETVRATPAPGGGGDGFGGGGEPRTSAPGAVRNLMAVGGDGQVVLTWRAPASDGGAEITDYEYRINGRNPWISTGSTETTHTVTDLVNGTAYVFEVRAVNRIGKGRASSQAEAAPVAPEVFTLDFTHFANGDGTTSDLVFVNVAPQPVRPVLYFYDTEGNPIAAESVVDITGDLEITEDGGLTVQTEMEPLGVRTVSTHGQGALVSGSVKVVSDGPIGGMLRYNLPAIGEAVVGASPPVRDALFAVRRQEGGITTGVAVHNLEEEAMEVMCRLMSGGVLRDAASIPLEANGQTSWLIDQAFPAADTSDLVGSVHCDAPGRRRFSAVALEVDPGTRIFTTLPVFPVDQRGGGPEAALDFAHFANGDGTTSDLVFVNLSTQRSRPAPTPFHTDIPPTRPTLYFYDTEGNPIAAESVVDVTGDLEVQEDGGLTVRTEMEPLGELTIATHGRGALVSGSVKVVSDGPIGGMLRFDLPHIGEAVVGASPPVRDAIFPVRRREEGITTGVAIHNLESSPALVHCDLMREGVLRDVASIPLEANGQTSWLIDQAFPATDTSDFVGSVRCDAVGEGRFSAVALEMDPGTRIFTTLPVFPVPEMPPQE